MLNWLLSVGFLAVLALCFASGLFSCFRCTSGADARKDFRTVQALFFAWGTLALDEPFLLV